MRSGPSGPDHLRQGRELGIRPGRRVIISDAIADAFDDRVFPGGLTYSGHPLAAASIVASAMEEEGVVANAARIGADVLGPGLADLAARHELVGEVRGTGVFWAIELVCDRATGTGPRGHDGPAQASSAGAGSVAVRRRQPIHVVPARGDHSRRGAPRSPPDRPRIVGARGVSSRQPGQR